MEIHCFKGTVDYKQVEIHKAYTSRERRPIILTNFKTEPPTFSAPYIELLAKCFMPQMTPKLHNDHVI